MVFEWAYEYASAEAAGEAMEAARDVVAFDEDEPDADLMSLVRGELEKIAVHDGSSVRVRVDCDGPPGLYPIYESIVEELADHAEAGMVTSRMEGEEVEYRAGREDD